MPKPGQILIERATNERWVCLGYRTTTNGSHSYQFAQILKPGTTHYPYVYNATYPETIAKKFEEQP